MIIENETKNLINWILGCNDITFCDFEGRVSSKIIELAKLFICLFLTHREELWNQKNPAGKPGTVKQRPKSRLIGTLYGKVRYWRTYLHGKDGKSYFPLDIELGLPKDGFSMNVRSLAANLATKMSYAQSVIVLTSFLNWSPCQKTVEEMVLGLGRYTDEWFEHQSAPMVDGDILIIQIDSKATPTATDEELKKRRGKRKKKPACASQRHRSRHSRFLRGKKKRKKKGCKSKNGKATTVVVLYTLKRSDNGKLLLGPINKRVYASYAPKRHAVAIAKREAEKRGFHVEGKNGNKQIQIVTDGDTDLELYIEEMFPNAMHTIDIYHVAEYLWKAGRCLFKEGSDEIQEWVEKQKRNLYNGKVQDIIEEIEKQKKRIPQKGHGKKRENLQKVLNYLIRREDKMNYKTLRKLDLEISSGAVEGAVNHVVAKRFDSGEMRWIKERSESLLHLRCIDINGDWDAFIEYVHNKLLTKTQESEENAFLKATEPKTISTFGIH